MNTCPNLNGSRVRVLYGPYKGRTLTVTHTYPRGRYEAASPGNYGARIYRRDELQVIAPPTPDALEEAMKDEQ